MLLPWAGSSMSWSGDDPDPDGRSGVAGDGAHGSPQRVCQPVAAGSGGAAAGSVGGPPVLLSRPPRRSVEGVRERFSCRDCETITQPPAPFHITPRGFAGPNLLATILFEKFGQHQPLNRQSERFAREGIELSVSTLADQVGACATALRPIHGLIEAHVLAA